ncbi:hypothetical protein ACOSQ2_030405 [Xanthoceras sorbifolium]
MGSGASIMLPSCLPEQVFRFRTNQLCVGSISAQIIVLPLGRLMAATLPTRVFHVPLTNWKFSLNPGPFNLKEHVLITIFAGCGAGGVYAVHIITIVKVFYKRSLHPVASMLLAQTTQLVFTRTRKLLGYGWAGLFRKYLVDSPYMWWPSNLVQVSLFSGVTRHYMKKRRDQREDLLDCNSFAWLCLLYSSRLSFPFLVCSLHCLLDIEGLGHITTDWFRHERSRYWLLRPGLGHRC